MKTVKCRGCQIAGRFPSRLLWWACVSVCVHVGVSGLKVKFGVLLPKHPVLRTASPCASLPLTMAEESLIAEDLAPFNWVVVSSSSNSSSGRTTTSTAAISVQFDYSNTNCSDLYGPFCAMEFYYRGVGCGADERPTSKSIINVPGVLAFYGPCCKYALSPVARYVRLWGVPIITPGGLMPRFGTDPDFAMLTRVIAPYEKFAQFLIRLLIKYHWRNVSFLLHHNLGYYKTHGYLMCYDIWEAAHALIEAFNYAQTNATTTGKEQFDEKFNEHLEFFDEKNNDAKEIDKRLNKISNASRSKFI